MSARLCAGVRASEKHVWESAIASGRRVCYGDSSPKSPCVARCCGDFFYHKSLRFWTFLLLLSRTAMSCCQNAGIFPLIGRARRALSFCFWHRARGAAVGAKIRSIRLPSFRAFNFFCLLGFYARHLRLNHATLIFAGQGQRRFDPDGAFQKLG